MTDVQQQPLGQVLRLSVVVGDRTIDVAAPRSVPVAELIPGLARRIGVLDPSTVYGGYSLRSADGGVLDPDRSLQALGVNDGAVLTLVSGASRSGGHRVYDDIVEAVADVVESDDRAWSPKDSALTAVLAAGALLLTAAVLLFGSGGYSLTAGAVSGIAALVLLASALVVGRSDGPAMAPVALIYAASAFAFVAGYRGLEGTDPWGLPLIGGGVGLMAVGVIGLFVLGTQRELSIVPTVVGAGLLIVGVAVQSFAVAPGLAYAGVAAVVGLAGIGIPWLALASTPLRVISPRDDEEILADVPPVEREEVENGYRRGHRLQIGLRIGAALLTLIGIPVVVGTGAVGTILLLTSFTGMLLSVRETYSRTDVIAVTTAAVLGVVGTGLAAALMHPDWRTILTVGVGAVAAVIVGFTLVAPKQRLWLGRLADTAELLCMGALLPLMVVLIRWGA